MSEARKSIGAGKLVVVPDKRLRLSIGEGAVKAEHIADKAITPQKVSPNFVEYVTEDVQNQIDSIQIGGWAISNQFGSDSHIGISQKTLTDAINRIWQKLEDITGEMYCGFMMTVTATYFVGEEGCTLHITANTADNYVPFDKLSIYLNGTLLVETENVNYFEYDAEITETTLIRCVGKIMGVEYERRKLIAHYTSFWLGAGQSYEDIMDEEHLIPINEELKGNYDVTVDSGDHIIIIMGEQLAEGFARADMNGVEIPFDESSITVSGENYKVFTSVNSYNDGTFNIDINS